jgi:hypothetical protein
MGDIPDPPPSQAVPFDPGHSAEAAMSLALQSMTHAAGLAMQSGPHAQACARQVTAAAVAMACKGLIDLGFATVS